VKTRLFINLSDKHSGAGHAMIRGVNKRAMSSGVSIVRQASFKFGRRRPLRSGNGPEISCCAGSNATARIRSRKVLQFS
ncbi:MAG: hypothetical protein LBQ62_03985, partial [Candidatus Accumulibacter sp.]|nr:hypothetical protein [Accumulibacter sp.]